MIRPPLKPLRVLADLAVTGAPMLAFDWQDWSGYTAIMFGVVNKGANPVMVTPEISHDGAHVITVGDGVPAALVVPVNESSYDPYGVDRMVSFWRLWLSGNSTVDVYVYGIRRGA
jgi:hypothetical protein